MPRSTILFALFPFRAGNETPRSLPKQPPTLFLIGGQSGSFIFSTLFLVRVEVERGGRGHVSVGDLPSPVNIRAVLSPCFPSSSGVKR